MERIELGNTLTLTIPAYPGVVVKCRGASQFKDFALMRRLDALSIDDEAGLEALDDGLAAFGDRFLIDWNVNTDGEPLEPTGDNLLRLPSVFQLGLLHAWAQAANLGGVAAPLGNGSRNGNTSKVASAKTVRK